MNFLTTLRVTTLSLSTLQCLPAQSLFWNVTPTGNARDGNWTSGLNWNSAENGTTASNVAWPLTATANQTTAFFTTAGGGLVSPDEDVAASGIVAGSGGLFEIGSPDHSLTKDQGIFTIDVRNGISGGLIIYSDLAVPEVLKLGPGILTFNGFTDANLTIDQGGIVFSGGNLGPGSILDTLPGTTARAAGDLNISRLTTNGTITGAGKITANSYHLFDGARIESDLGPGNLIFAGGGLVVIEGAVESDVISVSEGTMQLSGGNLGTLAQVSTLGTGVIELNGDQTVGTYLQVGGGSLGGSGTLSPTFGATLRGGDLAGNLAGEVSVLGDTTVSGSISGEKTTIESGVLTVTGTLASDLIQITPDSTLTSSGDLGDHSEIENSGTFEIDSDAQISRYTQEMDSLSRGNGTLTVSDEILLNGGIVAGNLVGKTTIPGNVSITGSLSGDSLTINGGTTQASGTLASDTINIANGTLIASNGSLGDNSALLIGANGKLTLSDAHLVKSLTQSGLLNGRGTLQVSEVANLQNSSEIDLPLNGPILSNGNVTVLPKGVLGGPSLDLASGILTSNGQLSSSEISVAHSATLLDRAVASFSAQSRLTNSGIVEFSGTETLGSLLNRQNARLSFAIRSPQDRDMLTLVNGGLTLEPDSILVIRENALGLGQRAQIISGPIIGSFSEIQNLDAENSSFRLSFDPSQGSVLALPGVIISRNQAARLFNLNRNQTQIYGNAFDLAYVDPLPTPAHADGSTNFRRLSFQKVENPDGFPAWVPAENSASGDLSVLDLDPGGGLQATQGDPQLALVQNAVTAIQESYQIATNQDGSPQLDLAGNQIAEVSPAGLSIIDQISPGFYGGFGQITADTLRAQTRRLDQHRILTGKNGFSISTDLQLGNGGSNWDFSSFTASVQKELNAQARVGVLLGASHGDLDRSSGSADVSGLSLGLFGHYQFQDRCHTRGFASLGFLSQEFDATRQSFGGRVSAKGIDSTATELALGVQSNLFQKNKFSLHPRASLRYLVGEIDSFRERGSGLALRVGGLDVESFTFETGLDAHYELNEKFTFDFGLGWVHDFTSSDESYTAAFATQSPFRLTTEGQDVSAFTVNAGASYLAREDLIFNLGFRGELRTHGPDFNLWSLGGNFSF